MSTKSIYLIGSLRNPAIPRIAFALRSDGYDVFDDWFSAGPNADDHWRDYEKSRGHSFMTALKGYSATHIFEYDYEHINRADTVVLVAPAGKSGHLELGYGIGKGKRSFILLDGDPERFDVMYKFADMVTNDLDELRFALQRSF